MNKKSIQLLTALAAGACFTASVTGQVVISTLDDPTIASFSGFDGTVATLPTGLTFSNTPGEGGFFNYDSPPGLTPNSLFAFRESASDPVLGFVYKRPAGTPANIFVNLAVQNNTGVALTDFSVSFDFLQPTIAGRATEIQVTWNPGSGFTTDGVTNGGSYFASFVDGSTTIALLDPYVSQTRTIGYSATTPIEDGQTVIFAFNVRSGAGGGNNPHVGFSNLSITASPIPEPSTYAAIVGALFLGLVLYRRRQNR